MRLSFFFLSLICFFSLNAQDFENLYKKAKYDEAKFLINKKLQQTGDSLSYHLKMAEAYERERKIDSADIYLEKIILDSLNLVQKADYYYLKARVYDQQLNQTEEALNAYTEARKRYKALGNIKQLNKIRYYLFYLLSSDTNTLETAAKNLDTLQKEAIKHEDTTGQILAALANAARNFSPDKAEIVQKYLDDAYQLSESSGNLVNQETAASYYGLHYLYNKKQPANAEIWLNESIRLSEEMDNPTALLYAYINRAVLPREQKNYRESVDWLLKAEEVLKSNTVYDLTLKGVVYENLAKDFENLKVYDSSLIYHKEYMKADSLFNYSKQNIGFMEYQLREVEKTNSLLERQKALDDELLKSTEKVKERTEKIALLLGVLLILILILGALFFKTIQRKRKIAEQQQQLEQEKVKQLVKEQEIQAIDAMISGQEKERERLAGELHDNLGSLMATLKLHFENYKSQVKNPNQEKILNNTDTLLDEAYQKVRSMAHARNTGVIAKYGLLPAIENFAAKVSATQKLSIDVSHNDFTDRLENTLELRIFRMVQELITNVIKHANATEVQLQLARHEDYINILIEDNGKGFNPAKLPQKQGMGLSSIKKRVEIKGGNLHIDSSLGHGTTVSIDIPLA
jgi:signal transduction histidine kinase